MRVTWASCAFAVASFAATVATALGQTTGGAPPATPSPSLTPVPGAMDPVTADFQLSLVVWLSTLALAAICSVAYFASRAAGAPAPRARKGKNDGSAAAVAASPTSDKDLEASRISYGFWLIIAGFLVTLAVVIVTINHFRPGTGTTADVVAVVTAVTGVIGTLTAAFFGIQAAGAGRSQALSALSEQMKNGSPGATTDCKIDPLAGPHAGNTRVSITGNGFTGANAVNFGATAGVNPEFTNDGLIYVTTPAMELDRNAATQKGKSDVDVTVVFPGAAAQNKVVGKFYYYTVDVEREPGRDDVKYVLVYGTGLAGASQVQFDALPPVAITKAIDDKLQIEVPSEAENPQAWTAVWTHVWTHEVDVTIIYGADVTATKRMSIGRFRIPQYSSPTPTVPVKNDAPPAASGGQAEDGSQDDQGGTTGTTG